MLLLHALACESQVPPDEISRRPPGPPTNGVRGDGPGYTFAVTKLFIGDTDRNGVPNYHAWAQFGDDIDGRSSTAASVDVCQPSYGGSPKVHDDGVEGIDNAWGDHVVWILRGGYPEAADEINQALAAGSRTYLFRIEALGDAASYIDMIGRYYVGAALSSPPKLDGTDVWPVTAESLTNADDVSSTRWLFSNSYVNDHVWVSGAPATLAVPLEFAGRSWLLTIHHAVITMRLAPDRAAVSEGVISGIVDPEDLIAELHRNGGSISSSLCDDAVHQSLSNQLRQAADILIDGSQDPAQVCNGISIGLGFEAVGVVLGDSAPPQSRPSDPCR